MGTMHCKPGTAYTRQEQFLTTRLVRTRKLFGFLHAHRHELFDDAFEAELESMYRKTGAGRAPVPPAMLAVATLLQACHGMPDAEAVEMSVVDLRWQLVLDRLGSTEPAFSQGALLRVPRTSHSPRYGAAAARAHSCPRVDDEGVRRKEASEDPAHCHRLDAPGRGWPRRRYDQPARSCCAEGHQRGSPRCSIARPRTSLVPRAPRCLPSRASRRPSTSSGVIPSRRPALS